MTFRSPVASMLTALSLLVLDGVYAQAPAQPSSVIPASVSPLYVVTYVETNPELKSGTAALLKVHRDDSRKAAGNLRYVVLQSPRRPGQFVIASAWQDIAAWETYMSATATTEFRNKLVAVRSAPIDDRFNASLSVGSLAELPVKGAVYGVTHVDVIPPRLNDAVAALTVLGEATRRANGNLRFEIVQQTNRPNHFTVFEIWRSREAFDANIMAPPQREFRDKLGSMSGALYDERLYELLE